MLIMKLKKGYKAKYFQISPSSQRILEVQKKTYGTKQYKFINDAIQWYVV